MKIGVRKPSLKKSLKARTTGKVKRKLKKTINPLYGKKGMGYVKNPKKAIYNKVYHKTTVGVPAAVRVVAGGSKKTRKKTNSKKSIKTPLPTGNNNQAAKNMNQYYKIEIKDKPSIVPTIVCGVITVFCITSLSAFVFMIFITLSVFAYYKYKINLKDYYTDDQLEDWYRILFKYDGISRSNITYNELKNASITELNKAYNRLMPYVNMVEPPLKTEDYLYAITISDEIIDLSSFIQRKTTNEKLTPEYWRTKREYYLHQYYKQEYNMFVLHAKSLKTENGKKKQIERYIDKVERDVSAIDPDYEKKLSAIINENDFL